MKRIFLYACLLFTSSPVSFAQKVISITVDGTINPVTAGIFTTELKQRLIKKRAFLFISNTPGGLLQSTRVIVSDLLQSPVPVIVYVSPAVHMQVLPAFLLRLRQTLRPWPREPISALHIPCTLQGGYGYHYE